MDLGSQQQEKQEELGRLNRAAQPFFTNNTERDHGSGFFDPKNDLESANFDLNASNERNRAKIRAILTKEPYLHAEASLASKESSVTEAAPTVRVSSVADTVSTAREPSVAEMSSVTETSGPVDVDKSENAERISVNQTTQEVFEFPNQPDAPEALGQIKSLEPEPVPLSETESQKYRTLKTEKDKFTGDDVVEATINAFMAGKETPKDFYKTVREAMTGANLKQSFDREIGK